MVNNLI